MEVVAGRIQIKLGTNQKVTDGVYLKPKQAKYSSNAHVLPEDFGDGHASINQLLTSFITNRCHEGGRFPDQAQLLQRWDRYKHFSNTLSIFTRAQA